MQREKSRVDHHHLLVKELMQKVQANGSNFRQRLKEKGIDYYIISHEDRKEAIAQVVRQFKESEEGQQLAEQIQSRLKEQVEMITISNARKYSYLIDCYRQATAFPFTKDRTYPAFNFSCLNKGDIRKQLRRVIWSRSFNTDRLRMAFSKLDREVTPYKVQQELKISLEKATVRHNLTLRDSQIDNALRIVEYFLKSQEKLPQRYHFYMALIIVDLYSYTKSQKIVELGAVSLGVAQLLQYYNEPIQTRLSHLKAALQIIDGQSYAFMEANYLKGQEEAKNTRELLQSFQMFRLTAGGYFLPLETGQFIIDKLLTRKRCKLDIYSLFSIMILIISDEFQPKLAKGCSLKEILETAKAIVKKQEYVEAYSVIFQNIPIWFSSDDLVNHPNNKLLAAMLSTEREEMDQEEKEEDDEEFVMNLNVPVRIGQKK